VHGARIDGIEQIQDDRIVRIGLHAREGPYSLIAELTGRRADLLLLDVEERIVTTLKTGYKHAGQPYRPPPRPERINAGDMPPIAENAPGPFPVSADMESRYRQREDDLAIQRLRQGRAAELNKRIKKTIRRLEALHSDLDRALRYREYGRYGELLKAHLDRIAKGQERLTVTDYFDPALPELTIPLDPAKAPQGNMEDYFKKHRKYLAAEREIRPRITAEQHALEELRRELDRINHGDWRPPLVPIRRTPGAEAAGIRSKGRPQQAHAGPFRRFTSADGLPIYVGRNAKENEALTFGEGRPDDLWLHAHGTPGSHVLVRLERGGDPPPETIRDAATLAVLYSDLKKSGKGDVIYTRRKYVRKVKGRSPGTVSVTHEKTVFVTLDRVRLDRLKARGKDSLS
jgi:predicted ribosome quality control (RQC) complex YloA/Tae2 family protein